MISLSSLQSWYLYSSSVWDSTHLSTSVKGNGDSSIGTSPMLSLLKMSILEVCSAGTGCWDRHTDRTTYDNMSSCGKITLKQLNEVLFSE